MIELKCPFCQQELSETIWEYGERETTCSNCDITGNSKLWKALDKAKWWLNEIVENHRCTPISTAEMALKEITALEQKDVK